MLREEEGGAKGLNVSSATVVGERVNIAAVCMTEVYMCSIRVSSNIITSSYAIGTLVQGCKQGI